MARLEASRRAEAAEREGMRREVEQLMGALQEAREENAMLR